MAFSCHDIGAGPRYRLKSIRGALDSRLVILCLPIVCLGWYVPSLLLTKTHVESNAYRRRTPRKTSFRKPSPAWPLLLTDWEEKRTTEGNVYYQNHTKRITSWTRPSVIASEYQPLPEYHSCELPSDYSYGDPSCGMDDLYTCVGTEVVTRCNSSTVDACNWADLYKSSTTGASLLIPFAVARA